MESVLQESFKAAGNIAAAVKAHLAEGEREIHALHLDTGKGRELPPGIEACRAYTGLIDGVIRSLFLHKKEEYGCNEPVSLVAVGGYGRGELNVRSDIDLMLVYRKRLAKTVEELTQAMLYVLWDTGLDMGFSIRSLDECLSLGREDLKTMTSLLDMRPIAGDDGLYRDLARAVGRKLFTKKGASEFIKEKYEENKARLARYGESVYLLEPNVKEGVGGLRDFHTARWVVKARNLKPTEPFSPGQVPRKDRPAIEEALNFILWVRNDLHFSTGRKTDQLSFDHQERMAQALGFERTEHALAVEVFMQTYYRHATNLHRHLDHVMSRALEDERMKVFLWPRKRVRVDGNFTMANGYISLRDRDAFEKDPLTIIKAFEYSQALDADIDQSTKDLVLESLDKVDDGVRSSPEVAGSFLRILRNRSVFKTLSEMHSLRFLERYIPEFGDITCRVQHDIYHIYTVDTHTLFAVRELDRLRTEHKAEFILQSTIYEELRDPAVLMLAILFHDIGKAHGKGHAEKGARLVPGICKRLGLSDDDAELVEFLVRHHLLLADTAQYRDLHDEKLIVEFARKVGDIERLNLLFLLTFADVRAVGPEVWSQWKGALFQELYFKAITVLERGTFEVEDAGARLVRVKEKVLELLMPEGYDRRSIDDFFGLLPQRYFLATRHEHIADHMKLLKELGGRPYIMKVRQDTFREYTELIISTRDVHGLFAMITGVMAANMVNILGAQIYTLKDGTVLDILQVDSPYGGFISDEAKLEKIERDLADVITGRVKVDALVARRKPSILDKKPKPRVQTTVQVDNEVSDSYTVIDIHAQNRVGLLYDITRTLSALGLYIYISKIVTKGDEAADIFYVKDIFGQKIYYEERLREIAEKVRNALEGRDDA